MKIEQVQIRRAMRDQSAERWAAALGDPRWIESSRLLKHEAGSSWVRRATIAGREVVVKCRVLGTPGRRVKSLLRQGHGDRHWRAAARLAMKRIATATPVVLAGAVIDGQPCELLVLEYLDGPSLLEVLSAVAAGHGPGPKSQHAVARAAGASVVALLDGRLWNRDHKPSNLIVLGLESGEPRIAVIDCVGIRAYGRLGIDEMEGEHMAASLMIEPTGCGCPPRRSLWMRALHATLDGHLRSPRARADRHAELRAVIETVRGLIESHGDPRPRHDPLGTAAE